MKNIDVITACEKAKEALKNNFNGNAAEIIHALQAAAEKEQRAEKAKKKAAKDKSAPTYILTTENGQKVHTNAIYLLDVMECLPGATAKASARGPLYPVYFESENGRGILCPVRPKEGAPA